MLHYFDRVVQGKYRFNMQLTTKGRYAVMAMVDLALHSENSPVGLSVIASRQNIDFGYLEQIFIKIKKVGLVKSTKGPGGGYQLAKDSSMISINEILEAVEESTKMTRCSIDSVGCMDNESYCVTHHLWEELGNHISNFLSTVTLHDICMKKFTQHKSLYNYKTSISHMEVTI